MIAPLLASAVAGWPFRFPVLALLLAGGIAAVRAGAPSVQALTANGRVNPLGISGEDLSLGWTIASDVRGTTQSAYEVCVGTSEAGGEVWSSGRVESDRQTDIAIPRGVWLRPATRYFWRVRIWDGRGAASDWSAPAWFEIGLTPDDWAGARWIAPAPAAVRSREPDGADSLPLFRRVLAVAKPVARARLYASAQGVYQLSLNGEKVGDQFLAPGWTDYPRRLQVQTYDVTAQLRPGENVIGATLGDGWYRGKVGIGWRRVYGDTLALIARLRVTYADGSSEDFVTDDHWRWAEGPLVQADLQDGEHYDARRAWPGWDQPGFDATAWSPVGGAWGDTSNLVPQPDEPVRAIAVLTARDRTEPAPGEYVYDLGQNVVGVSRLKLSGRAGQTVRIRYAEELNRLGPAEGRIYTENFRSAKVTDTYTFAQDGSAVYQPTFTQHGFRYIELTGIEAPPAVADVQAVVLGSDLPDTGDLRVPDPMLDQLVRNIRWGQRGNFLSIPTDTPARDERLGWTGDIAVFSPTASRYQDTRAFLSKWLDDLRDAQRVDGNIPAVVPQPRGYFNATGVGWSDAFIAVPYAVWRATGDLRIVRRNWDGIRRFYRFVHESATHDGDLLEQGRTSFFSGDWLHLENVDRLAEHRVIATAYFAENTRMMAAMAAALGDEADAAEWAALLPRIRSAFVAAYRRGDGSIELGTQTVYAMALGMDLIDEPAARAETAARFVEKLAADDYHLRTGFLGTPWLLPALTKIGRDDLAMRMLRNDTYPSWGFEVRMGATTMWERWNSIRADGQFGPVDMNSFNHYAYGAVGDWMFAHLGGVELVEPGYRRFRIAPLVCPAGVDQARCELRTPRGLIVSDWVVAGDELRLTAVVPANTSAEIVVPAASLEAVRESGQPLAAAPGVSRATVQDGVLHAQVGTGRYEFVITMPPAAR